MSGLRLREGRFVLSQRRLQLRQLATVRPGPALRRRRLHLRRLEVRRVLRRPQLPAPRRDSLRSERVDLRQLRREEFRQLLGQRQLPMRSERRLRPPPALRVERLCL
jgi:hypothetical protein